MANNDKRLNYFNGQFLQDTDFKTEQAYHVDRQRRHNRLMHTFGIAEGLAVNALTGASTVGVTPGTAIDGQGQQIVLFDPRTLQLGPQQTQFLNKMVLVVLSYAEGPSDPAQVGGSGNTRTWENPNVQIVVDDGTAPAPDVALRLARLKVDNGGLVSGALDLSVRVNAGARVGSEVDVPILKLQTAGIDASQWPAFTSNAAGEADLAGSLVVSGDIKVGNAPQSVAVHIADKNNPHGVTAAQIGVPTSVGGISNPGGNIGVAASGGVSFSPDNFNKRLVFTSNAPASIAGITNPGADIALVAGNTGLAVVGDPTNHRILLTPNAPASVAGVANPAGDIGLAAGGAIVLTPDNSSNKRITISENHSTNTNNPHLTTAAQVGAIVSVGGVSNPGGPINLAAGGAITINSDNFVNKRITISENHSTVTGNPHGTLASQLSDYDYGKRSIVSASFTQGDADGATRTLNVGFQPRFVWHSGGSNVYYSTGYYIGAPVSGFADLRSGTSQYGTNVSTYRFAAAPYQATFASSSSGYLVSHYFLDYTTATNQQISYNIFISSVTATGLVLTLSRTTAAGYAVPSSGFYVYISLACVG